MTEVVGIPASFDSLLGQISTKFNQAEAAQFIHELKRLYPTNKDSFDQTDLYGALKQLYVLGAIDEHGDQKVLEILTGKISKNKEIVKLLSGYKEVSSPRKDGFVGRDTDASNIIKLLTDCRIPGLNVFGDSGVGKTTLAKEVSKTLAEKDFEPFIIDLRGTKDTNTVYYKVLETFELTPWDYSKERIYTHLQNVTTKTLLILDNVEQFLASKNEVDEKRRKEFLEFVRTMMSSEASQRGSLKVILTSRIQIKDVMLKDIHFSEYELQPLTKEASRQLMSWRIKDETDDEQDKALIQIADLCRNTPYLLKGVEQLLRQNYSKPSEVLHKVNSLKNKGVPEKYVCISLQFDSLPSDHLKQVAVKISLLRCSFSLSTAMKIAEISSDYNAELELEMLAIHKIITAEIVNGERKYDLHDLFREFVTSYLCKEDPVYKDEYEKAENQFLEHFFKRFIQLANNLDKDFVGTYKELEKDKANLEWLVELTTRKETLDFILQSSDVNVKEYLSVAIMFEALKSIKVRRKLFGEWAEIVEKKGSWLSSTYFRCLQSAQLADMGETLNAWEALKRAEMSLAKAMLIQPDNEQLKAAKGLCKYCSGRIKCMSSAYLIGKSSKLEKERLLKQAFFYLEQSLAIHKEVYGDHTLTARTLNLIGNCYMECGKPKEALTFYQRAMDMKIKLVGSEKHFDIPIYYNQLSQVYEALGKEETSLETSWSFQSLANRIGSLISQEKRQNYDKAVDYLKKALSLQKELGVNDTVDTATFQRNLANILIGLGEYDQALEYAQKSFEIRNAHLGKHPETVRILYLIGIIHEWRKKPETALQSYEEAFVMEETLPEDNHSVVRKLLCDRLEAMCKKLKKKDRLKEYRPRIHLIMEIRSFTASQTQETISGEAVRVFSSTVDHRKEEEDYTFSGEAVRVSPSSVGNQRQDEDFEPAPSSAGHKKEEEDDTISAEPCLGHHRMDEDVAFREILINLSCVKKSKTILPSPGRSDGQEPVCVSYTVFKKVVTSNKPMKIKLMGNRCNEEVLSEFELSRGGYTKVARSKTDVSVEKEEKLKLDASICLGRHRVSIVQVEWKIKNQLIWEDEVLLESQGSNLSDEKLQLCLSLHDQSENLLFKKTHPIDMMVPNEWKGLGYDGRSTDPSLLSSKLTPNFNLSDEQKRWLVVGICLNKTLLPPLRDFLNKEMETHYNDMKTRHNINNQSHGVPLSDDHGRRLNYKSINNNETRRNSHLYDYNVTSAEDLGKLYLMPCMAKFTGFDDTCDMSAVLGILSSASVFSPDVQRLAKDVRSDVRNPWGHCNFQEWTDTKLTSCFKLMKDLVQALTLPADDEKRITEELGEWETKGMDLCVDVNYKANALLKFFEMGEEQISRLLKEVQKEEAEKRTKALESIQKALEKDKDQIKGMKQQLDRHEEEIKALKLASENK